jgi:hypothetical protein
MQIPFKTLAISPISTFSKDENEPNLNPISIAKAHLPFPCSWLPAPAP